MQKIYFSFRTVWYNVYSFKLKKLEINVITVEKLFLNTKEGKRR